MRKFKNNEYNILAATTVIEVGIDIPNVSVMLIENAERFGLSQLHQLRGRVGRGLEQWSCILMANSAWYDDHAKGKDAREIRDEKELAVKRLETLVSTTDGFTIAEVDLTASVPETFLEPGKAAYPNCALQILSKMQH